MTEHYYMVAGLRFALRLPSSFDADRGLPSFRDFRCELADCARSDSNAATPGCAFRMEWAPELNMPADAVLLADESNDMGRTKICRGGDHIFLNFLYDGCEALLCMDDDICRGRFRLELGHRSAGLLISSMLRCFFAQNILLHKGLSLHASCVVRDGKGYLFMGKSGTGKSTHSRLWIQTFPATELLNDDNPALRLIDGRPLVYGTPWSGKTPCWRNLSAVASAIVRLSQAPENRFHKCSDIEAFTTIYPGCSVLRFDERLHDCLCDTLSELIPLIQCGCLDCLPDRDAALCCYSALCPPASAQ